MFLNKTLKEDFSLCYIIPLFFSHVFDQPVKWLVAWLVN